MYETIVNIYIYINIYIYSVLRIHLLERVGCFYRRKKMFLDVFLAAR